MKAFHIINQLDLVSPGSLGSIFLPPFPEKVERFGFEHRFPYVWAGAGQGQPSEVPGGLKIFSLSLFFFFSFFFSRWIYPLKFGFECLLFTKAKGEKKSR